MTAWLTRADWGARAPSGAYSPLYPRRIIVHHSASRCCDDVNFIGDDISYIQGVQRFHMDGNGWNDIAYNFLISPGGEIWEGRGWGVRSAANGNNEANGDSYAVCFLGLFEDAPPTAFAMQALRDFRAAAQTRERRSLSIAGHRDVRATSCPGDALYALLPTLSDPITPAPTEEDIPMPQYVIASDSSASGRVKAGWAYILYPATGGYAGLSAEEFNKLRFIGTKFTSLSGEYIDLYTQIRLNRAK